METNQAKDSGPPGLYLSLKVNVCLMDLNRYQSIITSFFTKNNLEFPYRFQRRMNKRSQDVQL